MLYLKFYTGLTDNDLQYLLIVLIFSSVTAMWAACKRRRLHMVAPIHDETRLRGKLFVMIHKSFPRVRRLNFFKEKNLKM